MSAPPTQKQEDKSLQKVPNVTEETLNSEGVAAGEDGPNKVTKDGNGENGLESAPSEAGGSLDEINAGMESERKHEPEDESAGTGDHQESHLHMEAKGAEAEENRQDGSSGLHEGVDGADPICFDHNGDVPEVDGTEADGKSGPDLGAEEGITSLSEEGAEEQSGDLKAAAEDPTTTSSFTRSASAAGPGIERSSSPLTSQHPGAKKFSAVSINKRFLAKTGKDKESSSTTQSANTASKPSLLGSLIRASGPSSPGQALGNLSLRTGKLSSSLTPKLAVSGAAGGSGSTVWAKPAVLPNSEPLSLGKLESTKKKSSAPTRSAPTSGGPSIPAGSTQKKTWGQLMSEGGGFGVPAGRTGPGMEARAAKGHTAEGQQAAAAQAQQIAQARAAHNQAIVEGLDVFRGTNRDPNAHYWDEDDDEMTFDQVVDFGDGTTYTIDPPKSLTASDILPERPVIPPTEDVPIGKGDRFATDDFDRSWPPKGPQTSLRAVDPPKQPHNHASSASKPLISTDKNTSHAHNARALFNERSNRLENPTVHGADTSHRPQILVKADPPRTSWFGTPGPPSKGLQGLSSFERALPPHLSGSIVIPTLTAEVCLARRPVPTQTLTGHPGNARVASDWKERALPPHLAALTPTLASAPGAADLPPSSGQSRRLSEVKQPHPESNQIQVAPVNVPSGPAEPAPLPVDLDQMQKGEMHSAAERARLRRQQEEEERAAKAERAKQKAKDLEERLRAAGSPSEVAKPPQIETSMGKSPLRGNAEVRQVSPSDTMSGARVLLRRPSLIPDSSGPIPAPQSRDLGHLVHHTPSAGAGVDRPLPPHMQKTSPRADGGAAAPHIALPASHTGSVVASGQSNSAVQGVPIALPDSHNRPREADAQRVTGVIGSGPGSRPIVLQSDTWRKSSSSVSATSLRSGRPPVVNGRAESLASGLSHAHMSPPSAALSLAERAVPVSATPAPHTSGPRLETSQIINTDISHSQISAGQGIPLFSRNTPPANSTSSLEDLMAKIRFAMAAPSETPLVATTQPQPLQQLAAIPMRQALPDIVPIPSLVLTSKGAEIAYPAGEDLANATSSVVTALEGRGEVLEKEVVPSVPLPRPIDFGRSESEMPSSPKAAWKTFATRPPKAGSSIPKLKSRSVPALGMPVPPGWTMSWDPPLEQNIPTSMSRDDWLIGRSYLKGKIVYNVRVPSSRSKIGSMSSRPDATSRQPIAQEGSTAGRKIVVRLPPSRKQHQPQTGISGQTVAVPNIVSDGVLDDFAQTTLDVQTSPSSSHASPRIASTLDPATLAIPPRQRSPRRQVNGHGVTFARTPAKLASESIEQKASVRFMVSSELEGDNLLQEVNEMSLEGLGEGIAEELDIPSNGSSQPKTPTSPSAKSSGPAKSGPPSPNAATSAAWNTSGTYPALVSPARGLPNRQHIKNVWSQSAGHPHQQGNSLIGIADEFPSMLINSVQDLRDIPEDTPTRKTAIVAAAETMEEDSPRYASVSVASQVDMARPLSGGGPSSAGMQTSLSGQSLYSGHGHFQQRAFDGRHAGNLGAESSFASPHMESGTLSDVAHGAYATMPVGTLAHPAAFGGFHGTQPQGVWVPLNQSPAMMFPHQASNQLTERRGNAYKPGKAQPLMSPSGIQELTLNGYPPALSYGQNRGDSAYGRSEHPYMGMYSHSSGPVDSPGLAYGPPRGFVAGTSHPDGSPSAFTHIGARPTPYAPQHHSASASIGQLPGPARTRAAAHGTEQSRYGTPLLSSDKFAGNEAYAYRSTEGVGSIAQANLAANAVRQGHARGSSSGGMRRGPW